MNTSLFAAMHRGLDKNSVARLAGCALIFALIAGNALLNTAVASPTCRLLIIPPTVHLTDSRVDAWFYNLAAGQLGGTATSDSAGLELYSPATGMFDLGTGDNLSYLTCNQCVLLRQDVVDDTSDKVFFPDRGTLELSIAPGTDPMPVVFSNLRLVEVTIDPKTFQSTPVPGGECYVGDAIYVNGFEH